MSSQILTQAISFVAQVGVSYMLSRLTARDGPKLDDLSPGSGEYGVALPRVYGSEVRLAPPIHAQADFKETEHKVEDYSEVVGAISGAAQGFLIGGPVGAAIGAVAGFLFGAAAPDQKYYTYSVSLALILADRSRDDPIEALLKMFANGRTIFDAAELAGVTTLDSNGNVLSIVFPQNRYCKSIRVYCGGNEQGVDSVLAAEVGEVTAYRHRAYVVLEDLQLELFGNSVPPIEALIQARTGHTLADVVGSICAESGIVQTADLSTSELATIILRGYAVTSETTCWDAIKPLLPVYRFDAAETGGQVRFYKRNQGMRASIPGDELGAHEYGNTPPPKVAFTREYDVGLPQETSLTFLDPARDYQANTASSRRSEGDAKSNVSLTLQLTLTAEEGATAAATAHWDAWLGRTRAQFSLADAWIGIEPGRVYTLPIAEDRLPFRVTRKLRGANGVIEVEALSDESITYQGVVSGAAAPVPDSESTLFADTVVVPMNMPMQSDGHDTFGFYVAMGATKPYWTRGKVQVSGDGVTYATLLDYTQAAVMGDVVGTLASGTTTGLDDTLDTVSVLTVELLHDEMTLQSVTDAQLDSWRNFAFVGQDGVGEYLQFKTATKVGPRTWELTDLRRGRRGTDHAIGGHAAGDSFVLLGEGGIYHIPAVDGSGWGNVLTLRGVTLHQDEDAAATVTFTNTGEIKRPFSPVGLVGTFAGSDLEIEWTRRARFFDGDLHTDAPETYEVELYRNAALVRTETVTAPTYTYLAADQASDGVTDGDAIVVRVYQVNADYGRSRPLTAAFIQDTFVLHLEDGTTPWRMEDDLTPIGLG